MKSRIGERVLNDPAMMAEVRENMEMLLRGEGAVGDITFSSEYVPEENITYYTARGETE